MACALRPRYIAHAVLAVQQLPRERLFMLTLTEQSFTVFSDESGSVRAKEFRGMKHPGISLSVRERLIVRLMGDGLSNKRIARQSRGLIQLDEGSSAARAIQHPDLNRVAAPHHEI